MKHIEDKRAAILTATLELVAEHGFHGTAMSKVAKEAGGALARTEEYQSLKKAGEAVDQERDLVELKNRLRELEEKIQSLLRAGQQPDATLGPRIVELECGRGRRRPSNDI